MKTDKSGELFERAKKSMAGGLSSFARTQEPVPLFFEKAEGARLYDVDGNVYIDYIQGLGPTIFGHAPAFLREAAVEGLRRGQIFGGQHEAEIRVSRTMTEVIPCAELVRFASTGTEAVQAALLVARGATGRTKFIKFEGHYHGWMDSVSYIPNLNAPEAAPDEVLAPVVSSAGLAPSTAENIFLLPWNNLDVVKRTVDEHGDEIAAIITEPILCNTNCIIPRPGFLEGLRELCSERGIVLIFDEVITGFRVALGGAQEYLGITPDLATFAKAIAGGFPISMIAGKRELMIVVEDSTVQLGGTMNSNFQSIYAVEAELKKLMENDGAVYKQLYATSARLMDRLRDLASKHNHPALVQGPGPVFHLSFTQAQEITDYRSHTRDVNHVKYAEFYRGMMERGVRPGARGRFYISTAHTDQDIDETLAAADEVMAAL